MKAGSESQNLWIQTNLFLKYHTHRPLVKHLLEIYQSEMNVIGSCCVLRKFLEINLWKS